MENKKWYIGQKVWDKTESFRDGIVDEIRKESIIFCFPDTPKLNYVEYNFEGCKVNIKNMFSILKTLSTKPYEIIMEGFSQEVEDELPYKGQIVWVKHWDDDRWDITFFIKKIEHLYVCSSTNDEDNTLEWLQITTKNPYAVEEEVSKMETTDREPKVGDMCYFWDFDNPSYVFCGKLVSIGDDENFPFEINELDSYKYCSLKNTLIQ